MSAINIIFIIIGSSLLLLGLLIFKFKMVEILADYDEKKVTDKNGLARWTGSNLILMGVVVIISSLVCEKADLNVVFFYIPIVILITVRIVIGNRKYEKEVR